jgi:tetratricopeptide (TPR) repeat protein
MGKQSLIGLLMLLLTGCLREQAPSTIISPGDSLKTQGRYAEALEVYSQNLEQDIKAGNIKNQCKDYTDLANVYCRMALYQKSTYYYEVPRRRKQELLELLKLKT